MIEVMDVKKKQIQFKKRERMDGWIKRERKREKADETLERVIEKKGTLI